MKFPELLPLLKSVHIEIFCIYGVATGTSSSAIGSELRKAQGSVEVLGRHGYTDDYENHFQAATIRSRGPVHSKFSRLPAYSISALISAPMRHASPVT